MTNFEKTYHHSNIILTEGAIVERLKSEFNLIMDSALNHATMIYDSPEILAGIYQQYIAVAQKYQLPIMLMTPTRRVNVETLQQSSLPNKNVIADACAFLNTLRSGNASFSDNVFIGGLLGCKGDAYAGKKVLSSNKAFSFHKQQVQQFQNQGLDFLFAGIMPEINEAIGMAQAMDETELPYIISFMIQKNGCLMDGTPIAEAISRIDAETHRKPLCYMSNCVHPTNLKQALSSYRNINYSQLNRFKGIQANASALSPEELNNCGLLHQDDFESMVTEMEWLMNKFGLKIVGGCCGTNALFIEKLAKKTGEGFQKMN